MSLSLISSPSYPSYEVDVRVYAKNHETEKPTIQTVALCALQLLKCFFSALKESAYATFKESGISFKHIVLGHWEFLGVLTLAMPPADIRMAVFKIACWMLETAWCLSVRTGLLFLQKKEGIQTSEDFLLHRFAGKGIDIAHIQTKELVLDANDARKEVKLRDLLTMFDDIKFSDTKELGSILLKSLKRDDVVYTPKALKKGLKTFIKNVNERVSLPFGPAADDREGLENHYRYIEDAVLLSIYQVKQDLVAFQARPEVGTDPSSYSVQQWREYDALLTAKARVALDIAFAGILCPGRYTAEAMTVYGNLWDGKNAHIRDSLGYHLIELLTQKRKQIALGEIERLFYDPYHINIHAHTHGSNRYMADLGKMLAIPGSAGISEHYKKNLDKESCLKHFFEAYTVNAIIWTVEEAMRESELFREKITDWAKDQVGDWQEEHYRALAKEKTSAIQKILDEEAAVPSKPTPVEKFYAFILELKEIPFAWPSLKEGWDAFLAELFATDEAKKWVEEQLPPPSNGAEEVATRIQCTESLKRYYSEKNQKKRIEQYKRVIEHEGPIQEPLSKEESRDEWLIFLLELKKASAFRWPSLKNGWDAFLKELFATDEAKKWVETRRLRDKLRALIQTFKMNYSRSTLGPAWIGRFEWAIAYPGPIQEVTCTEEEIREVRKTAMDRDKIARMQKELSIDEEILSRLLSGESSLEEAIQTRLHQERQTEFLTALGLENMATQGVSREFMEWLLVSHHILLPQV